MPRLPHIALVLLAVLTAPARGADLVWEVENPFRFFKSTASYAVQERAYAAVRGNQAAALPADIVWRTERRLNDPDCRDRTNAATCAATARANYQRSRLGWAAQTLGDVCYESNASPRRYPTQCTRKYSWGSAKEDYVLPEAHTVGIGLSPERAAQAGNGACEWTWRPRAGGGRAESRKLPCNGKLTIARVPFSPDPAKSGVAVSVKLPDGSELADPDVVVEDLLIAALGDSFASGESNPDRPVTFSATRQMLYDPSMMREQDENLASRKQEASGFSLAAPGEVDPRVLPRRLLDDERKELIYKLTSPEFKTAFDRAGARWLSADCHRSQYGYPFRVGIQLTLENRHRAVTLVSLTCTGAEVAEGLFLPLPAREGKLPTVRPQFDQLSELICRGGAAAVTRRASYALPLYKHGSTAIEMRNVDQRWCPPERRKRPVDLVLMSIGGNDVGFSGLAAYAMTETAGDLAPVVALIGHEVRFPPSVSRAYLGVLDRRMQAAKKALQDGFGVHPARVVQTAYEPIQYDETGALCGSVPTLGMDVHPKLRFSRARIADADAFLRDLQARLACIHNASRPGCPQGLATGAGTGFNLVTEHLPKFARRGMCARDPKRALEDAVMMKMPRKANGSEEFEPYSPANELPYAHRWRLFRTPNDAFLIANTHREGVLPFDIVQPAYAGLYSGAVHPSAEGHAIVADSVMPHARRVLDGRPNIRVRPVGDQPAN